MKIIKIIENLKAYCKGIGFDGLKIDDNTSRDQVLFGDPNQECTGIVTTIYPSIDVIRKAIELNCNFIICHESLFWNHGDHQEWLKENQNKTYLYKKQLMDENKIVVFRNHDYIHSGIKMNDDYVDGIFYGVIKKLDWFKYLSNEKKLLFEMNSRTVEDIANEIIEKLNLKGAKIIGNKNTKVNRVWICGHIMGNNNEQTTYIDKNDIDLIIPLECIDYTTALYIKDSSMFNNKALITVGHFNLEEDGMEYMLEYLDEFLEGEKLPKYFIQAGDMYDYLVKKTAK